MNTNESKALAALKNLDTYHGYDWLEYGDQREKEIIHQAREAIAAIESQPVAGQVVPVRLGKTTEAESKGFRVGSFFGSTYLVDIPVGTEIRALLTSKGGR